MVKGKAQLNKMPISGSTPKLFFLVILSNLATITVIQSQMVPISGVITHPPSESSSSTTNRRRTSTSDAQTDGRPFDKAKIDTHTKIASSHLKDQAAQAHSPTSSFPTVETDEEGRKIIRKDKSVELQNPAKHSSDQNLLNFLLEQYAQITSSSSTPADKLELRLEILTNIQYFAHKFENGRDLFQATNALEAILLPGLNSTYYEVRQSICSIFAIAGQNNLIVQELAMKNGVLRQLIHIISTDSMVRAKALYALSSLLRNYEEGQLKFIQDGGVQILAHIAFLSETRQKSLTLLIDLIKEQKDSVGPEDSNETNAKNLIITRLKQSEWCELLIDNIDNLKGFGQEDQLLIIDAIYSSLELDVCNVQSIIKFESHFQELKIQFETVNSNNASGTGEEGEGDDEFEVEDDELSNVIELVNRIMSKINQELKVHDEL